ncbi:hypothetical protein [Nocardia sp. CA-120079]|uniref:hypothetical protein n=1 Tax=Nocardia sp. CA-120079 TaxID=3239974 RepID=UPI003D98D427
MDDKQVEQPGATRDDIWQRRGERRLASAWRMLLTHLGSIVTQPGDLVFAGDADGHLLPALDQR